jgi:prepilin-type N-terminal cleavage/methylation domain-containing protein
MNLLLLPPIPSSALRAPSSAQGRSHRAFTLIELVISAALMSLILTSAYVCLSAGTSSQKLIEARIEAVQNARVAMSFLTADLRSACALSKDSPFLGMQRTVENVQADNIDFATRNYTPKRPREGDYCQVSYFLQKDPASGNYSLWRRRNPTNSPDPLSGGRKEEIAQRVKGLRFQYYDGLEWYNTWGDADAPKRAKRGEQEPKQTTDDLVAGNLSGLPEAVRVTLYIDVAEGKLKESEKAEPPMVFQTVARLNLAAAQRQSSLSGQSGGSTPSGQATQGSQGTRRGGN